MGNIAKPKFKTQDDLVKYLQNSKKEAQEESKAFAQTEEFQKILKKLRDKKNQSQTC